MAYSLRWQRLIIVVGFLTVAIGWIGYTALIVWGIRSSTTGQEHFNLAFGIGSVVAYAVLAGAAWSWFRWIENSSISLAGLTRALRLFAVGNLCLAVGLAAVAYYWANQSVTQPWDGRARIVAAASYGLESFGFFLAAVAFWGASAEVHSARSGPSSPEAELVPIHG